MNGKDRRDYVQPWVNKNIDNPIEKRLEKVTSCWENISTLMDNPKGIKKQESRPVLSE